MEFTVKDIRAYHRNVVGCKKHSRDIMIAFSYDEDSGVHGVFLTQEQAVRFHDELERMICRNELNDARDKYGIKEFSV